MLSYLFYPLELETINPINRVSLVLFHNLDHGNIPWPTYFSRPIQRFNPAFFSNWYCHTHDSTAKLRKNTYVLYSIIFATICINLSAFGNQVTIATFSFKQFQDKFDNITELTFYFVRFISWQWIKRLLFNYRRTLLSDRVMSMIFWEWGVCWSISSFNFSKIKQSIQQQSIQRLQNKTSSAWQLVRNTVPSILWYGWFNVGKYIQQVKTYCFNNQKSHAVRNTSE
jgi:hypothetical protein